MKWTIWQKIKIDISMIDDSSIKVSNCSINHNLLKKVILLLHLDMQIMR